MKKTLKLLGVIVLITLFAWPLYLLLNNTPAFDHDYYDSDHNSHIKLENYGIDLIGLPRFGLFQHGGGTGAFVILANQQDQWLALNYVDSTDVVMLDYYEAANAIGYCRGGDTCGGFELSQYPKKPKFLNKIGIYFKAIYLYWWYETHNFLLCCLAITLFVILPILLFSSVIAGLWYAVKWIFRR